MTCVQSSNGMATVTPQQSAPPPGSAYLQSSLATLGFTAIAPAGQTLVQPVVTQQPVLAPAPPLGCQSHTLQGQASETGGQQVGSFLFSSKVFLMTGHKNLTLILFLSSLLLNFHRKCCVWLVLEMQQRKKKIFNDVCVRKAFWFVLNLLFQTCYFKTPAGTSWQFCIKFGMLLVNP